MNKENCKCENYFRAKYEEEPRCHLGERIIPESERKLYQKNVAPADKQTEETKKILGELKKIYEELPPNSMQSPRGEFIDTIARECRVARSTAWTWVSYGVSPSGLAIEKLKEIVKTFNNK